MKGKFLLTILFVILSFLGYSQEKIGDKWVDNNLTFEIVKDNIKKKGEFTFCIFDTLRGSCIQNLSTGIEVKAFDSEGKLIWEGIATGMKKSLKLPRPLPTARYLTLVAFKPWVANKSTGNPIHQDKPIEIKYYIK